MHVCIAHVPTEQTRPPCSRALMLPSWLIQQLLGVRALPSPRAPSPLPPRAANQKKCWCAAEVDLKYGEGTCDYPCTGDAGTTCGGNDAFDLFNLERDHRPLSPPTEEHYVGCLADDKSDRVLADKHSDDSMTLEVTFPARSTQTIAISEDTRQ